MVSVLSLHLTISALAMVLAGFDVGLIGAAFPNMRDDLGLEMWEQSVATAITYLMAGVGGLCCSKVADE